MKRAWLDAILVVVTLGFYIPYWIWRRNKDLREQEAALPDNLPWVAAGLVLALAAVVVAWDLSEMLRRALTVAAVLAMSYGVYVLADNAERLARARGAAWTIAPEALAALFAAAFLGIEAGNVFPSLVIRIPAMLLLLVLAALFFRVADEVDALAKPAGAASTS